MATTIHKNHLIVGLGGTGGNIIRSLRKLVFQNFRQDDPTDVNLRYLYVDSSGAMMAPDDPTWKILGRSVQLPERSQMQISGMNLRDVVDNLGSYPGISPWLGNREDFSEIISSAGAANVVGGQKRRLGRFLFACKAAEFKRRVGELVRDMHTNPGPGVTRTIATTFHVCCGLAGGTGSGSIVDAISQIRSQFPNSSDPNNQYRIIVYAVLPSRYPPPGHAVRNYHANGYAALLELNAMALQLWKPHDVTGVESARLTLQDAFNNCYLFGDENEAGVKIDLNLEAPDIMASYLFQKIVEIQKIAFGATSDDNPLLRQEEYENQDFSAERSPKGKPRRNRQFFSFGIKQIAYPEVEIREFLTYSFAREAVRQLLFNKWVDGQGYKEEATNQPFEEYVREKATGEKWYLTDERLSLSEGILPGEINNKKWRTISDFWRTLIPGYVTMVLDAHKDSVPKMLPEFTKLCDEAYREQYRGEGVAKFYETKRGGDLREQVREIRGRIEHDLFEDWRNGSKSMHDISRLLNALLGMIEERINGMDDKVSKLGEDSERYRENEAKIAKNREAWALLNVISTAFGKNKTILNAQAECFITRYTNRTRMEGLRYAKDLLLGLRQELNSLSSEVSKCTVLIAKVSKRFQTAVETRCADKGNQDLTKQVVRFYEPPVVHEFAKGLTTDKAEQAKQTSRVRDRLSEILGDKQTFSAFNNKISEGNFVDVLESTCEECAVQAHEQFVGRFPDRGRILQVGLIELMRKEYEGNDEALKKYVEDVMAMARNYLGLDNAQIQLVGPGIANANASANSVRVSNLTVIAPEAPDAREFREKLCRTVREATSTKTTIGTNARRSQEITLINITNLFPARFVSVCDYLKKEYMKLIEGPDGKRAYMELHSEGYLGKLPDGQEIPDLYPETYKSSDLRPWVMIADAMGLIEVEADTTTGVSKVYLATDDHGFKRMEELGFTVEQVIDEADVKVFETIRGEVESRLSKDYQHIDQRQGLLNGIRAKVEEVGRSHKSNDPVFINYRGGFVKAEELLIREGQYANQ